MIVHPMKATAVAPSNIAFIKYWGKQNEELRIPLNSSFSMNLSGAQTTTTVEFDETYSSDTIELVDGEFSEKEKARVVKSLDQIRQWLEIKDYARVATKNTFPKGAGSASSASGFAALVTAAVAATGKQVSEKDVTIFARLGSGSACRSIPDGFVLWDQGTSSETSYAYSVYPHDYWDLRDILVIVDSSMKKVSTTEGMELATTSPFLPKRLAVVPHSLQHLREAFTQKNFEVLGEILEEDCLDMHHVMQTQVPPLWYWNDITMTIMDIVLTLRKSGISVYFTIDAGPNVHIIIESKDEQKVLDALKKAQGIESVIVNKPAPGAHVKNDHLF